MNANVVHAGRKTKQKQIFVIPEYCMSSVFHQKAQSKRALFVKHKKNEYICRISYGIYAKNVHLGT
jgi:hypothetical protein